MWQAEQRLDFGFPYILASCPYTVSNLANCTWQAYFSKYQQGMCNCREQVDDNQSLCLGQCYSISLSSSERAFEYSKYSRVRVRVRKNENVVSQPKVKALHTPKRHRKSQGFKPNVQKYLLKLLRFKLLLPLPE